MPPKPTEPKIRYIAWRRGRPRFEPSPTLRAKGYQGHDLKTDAGEWMAEAEAREWSAGFARELEEAARQARRKRGRPKAEPVALRSGSIALGTLIEEWLTPEKNPSIADRRPKTLQDYRQKTETIRRHASDLWHASAEALDKPICLGLYDRLREKSGLHTAVGVMRVLAACLQWAMDRGRVPTMQINPAHKLRMKSPPPRLRVATREEIEHFVAKADEMGRPEVGDMITLAVWSGQRQADRLAFTYSGRKNGRIKLRQEKTRALVSILEAPALTRRLEAAMERRRKAEVISPYVIMDERRWTPMTADYYRYLYDDIRRAAAETIPSIATLRDQDFRDTTVTWLATFAHCTIPQICSITGHSFASASQVMKHYLATNESMADEGLSKLIDWYEKPAPTEAEESKDL